MEPTRAGADTASTNGRQQTARRTFGFETRMLHAGHVPDSVTGARAVPIYQTTSYVFEDTDYAAQLFELKQYGNIYTRINNPTTAVFEERLASLENGTGAVATASGMAAQFLTFMTLLEPGDEIVASSHLYGGTVTQLVHTLKKLSVTTHFVDPSDFDAWERAITKKTRLLYGETIGNPKGSILDIERLAQLAHSKRIPLAIDNTFATPYLCRPIDWGADIVVHSATKFIGGHGAAIAGAVVESGKFDYSRYPTIAAPSPSYHGLPFYDNFGHYGFLMKVRAETLRDTGACLSPFNAFLLIQGIETLSVRMDRHVQNAKTVAEFLDQHPQVDWVAYAGLPNHPHYDLARKYLPKGPGAVFSFGLKPGPDGERAAGKTFIESLQLFSHLANVGDARSLVIHPASTTHQQLSDEELTAAGITPGLIRLSIGLETTEDLIWDLEQALHAISR
jgi:O-acetylhomoserine (thiol)-lyase